MKLILGLGNPGEKYSLTRHNIGFMVCKYFQKKQGFSEFKLDKKFRALLSEGKIGEEKVLLALPQTFMNLSGESARSLLDYFHPKMEDFIVVYDDVDLPFGALRIRDAGGSAGHNGIKSLIQHFATQGFPRLRLGIRNEFTELAALEEFVLGKFTAEERRQLPGVLENSQAAILEFFKNGIESSMNKFN
ncbi:MAG: aminoacyl-tRNA hydrolase [Candidatus Gracilibacteria bacterium]|jgi:PTH1 family peptidyl-tRNA hydrolase